MKLFIETFTNITRSNAPGRNVADLYLECCIYSYFVYLQL